MATETPDQDSFSCTDGLRNGSALSSELPPKPDRKREVSSSPMLHNKLKHPSRKAAVGFSHPTGLGGLQGHKQPWYSKLDNVTFAPHNRAEIKPFFCREAKVQRQEITSQRSHSKLNRGTAS